MTERDKKDWLAQIKKQNIKNTPYILTDLSYARERVENLKSLLPEVGIYYAVKSNTDSAIIKEIDSLIEGYDVASQGEVDALLKIGVNPKRLLYSNPVKIPSHIKTSYERGVNYFAFDSFDEIKKLAAYAPDATAYIRIQVSDYGSKFPLSKKFGLPAAHVADYAATARDMGIKVKGLAFHVGSQSENPKIWANAFSVCGEHIKRLREIGINIEFIDMGGGLPADYGQPIPSIRQIARTINSAIKKHVPKGIRVISEPGRHITANSSVLVASIIAREHRSGADWLYLDMGVFQGLMEPLETPSWKYPIFTEKNTRGYKKEFVLTGPTCDAFDTIGSDYLLPADLDMGDKLYIAATGAYSTVYGSNFNGFPIPPIHYINQKRHGQATH